MVAAGCGGTGRELAPYLDLERLTLVTRSLTLAPRASGPPPLLEESPGGLVHRTPLWNPGLAVFLDTELPWLVRAGVRVFVSVVAASLGEYAELARRVGRAPGIAGVEVNLSVPDPAGTGLFDAREPFHAGSVVGAVRREVPGDLPVLAKLRPDVSRVVETARAVVDAGATAVVVGNALPAALADGRHGGLSGPGAATGGPALRPRRRPGAAPYAGGGRGRGDQRGRRPQLSRRRRCRGPGRHCDAG